MRHPQEDLHGTEAFDSEQTTAGFVEVCVRLNRVGADFGELRRVGTVPGAGSDSVKLLARINLYRFSKSKFYGFRKKRPGNGTFV